MDIILNSLQSDKNEAIILHGGYARGEGSWITDDGGNIRPYNDYDILIITDKPKSEIEIRGLKKNLAKMIGIRWVDISQMSSRQLVKLKPSIYSYDLKFASQVIWGNKNVLEMIPKIRSSQISLRETEILFFTRIWTLLGSLNERGLEVSLSGEESRFFRNQMAKAVLAVVDGWLLLNHSYHFSYKERVKLIGRLYPKNENLIELSKWALKEKLFPKFPEMTPGKVRDLYERIRSLFINDFTVFLGRYYGFQIKKPENIFWALYWSPKSIIVRLSYILKHKSLSFEKQLKIRSAQLFIALAYGDNPENQRCLSKGVKIIKQLSPEVEGRITWDQARCIIAELRNQ